MISFQSSHSSSPRGITIQIPSNHHHHRRAGPPSLDAMCYQVKCGGCGKPTWAGCGRHVASVHAQIPEGQHCACRDWPGVAPPVEKKAAAGAATDDGKTSAGGGAAAAVKEEGSSAGSAEGGGAAQ